MSSIRRRPVLVAGLVAIVALGAAPVTAPPAGAGVLACGSVITTDTTLTHDVGPCVGPGLVIGADGITLNLGRYQVLGNADHGFGPEGESTGIELIGRDGVTVTGARSRIGGTARVAGFEAGIVIDGGSGNTVSNLMVEDNVGPSDLEFASLGDGIILFTTSANRIVNNIVRRNGLFDGIGLLGAGTDNNLIEGNVVDGTVGSAQDVGVGSGFGIILNAVLFFPGPTPEAVLTGNVIRGNYVRANDTSGITSINNADGVIENNIVAGNGLGPTAKISGIGSGIDVEHRPFAPLGFDLLIQGNRVLGNGASGVRLGANVLRNRILGNDSFGNGNLIAPGYGWDLQDDNPGCGAGTLHNHWGPNRFRTVFQGCEAGGLPAGTSATSRGGATPIGTRAGAAPIGTRARAAHAEPPALRPRSR